MLVLERKVHQRIMLTGGIVITIGEIDTRCKKVKIGIDAPDNIKILREEILLRNESNAELNGI